MVVSFSKTMTPIRLTGFVLCATLIFAVGVLYPGNAPSRQIDSPICVTDEEYQTLTPEQRLAWIHSLVPESPPKPIHIIEPLPRSVFPPDMASPVFLWKDDPQNSAWLMTASIGGKNLLYALVSTPWWVPEPDAWAYLRQQAGTSPVKVDIAGIGGWTGRQITSRADMVFRFSKDRIDARILFMQKPLPFREAKKRPQATRILAADPAAYDPPRVLLANPPVCANCHSYSGDGRRMILDMDFKGDKGAFLCAPLESTTAIADDQVYSWNRLPPVQPAVYSMGLFARLSPKGDFVAGTVDETSVFIMMDDLYFSQLFYPATGRIGIFNTRTKALFRLPGADLENRVQTAPEWHPDGAAIAFSAAPLNRELVQKVVSKDILKEDPAQNISGLNKKYPVQFDIFTIPFNDGKGGRATALQGASANGYSNYFPRYSPDGKWIVFTQSPTGLVLQPDSRLMIVPAGGGQAKPLRCNMAMMNSWHAWSPNSKWLVFTSKSNSPFTELFLTHIDERGEASPAIRLFRLSRNDLAAMVPEFTPLSADVPQAMGFASPDESIRGQSMAIDGR